MIGYIVLVCSKKGRPPISTRTDTRVPYATLFRSVSFRLTLLMRWRFNGSITFTPAASEQRRFRCRVGGNGQHIDLHPRTGPQPRRMAKGSGPPVHLRPVRRRRLPGPDGARPDLLVPLGRA